MASYNRVILAGNLTRDPELRFTAKGLAIAKFGLAVNRTWTSEAGEKKEDTLFVDIEAFGRQAETIGQYFKKGRPILLEGRLRMDSWDDKQTGQKRTRLLVALDTFSFIDSNRSEALPAEPAGARAPAVNPPAAPAPQRPAAAPEPVAPEAAAPQAAAPEEDDVPF